MVRDAFSRHRLSWIDALPWVAVVVLYFAANDYLPLGTQVMISIIFALALDLALGYGGVATLGHAAFFGIGAYAAGLYATRMSRAEPISGLVAALAAGGIGGAHRRPAGAAHARPHPRHADPRRRDAAARARQHASSR